MTKKVLAVLLAALMTLSFAACSTRIDENSIPLEENPPAPEATEAIAPPPELSLPEPETSREESSEPDEESSQEEEESEEEESEAPAEPGQLSLTSSATVTVDVVDATGSGTGNPQNLTVPLPGGWTVDNTLIMLKDGKVGEVEPCRQVTDAANPFSAVNPPADPGVFEAGGSPAITWSEEVNVWDEAAGRGAVMTVRHYYKQKGDLIYGMYFYLAYDGTKTISEVTAANIFAGLG